MQKIFKYGFLSLSVFFQLYLAYASTLYFDISSLSFLLVAVTTLFSIIAICYFILVVYERKPLG